MPQCEPAVVMTASRLLKGQFSRRGGVRLALVIGLLALAGGGVAVYAMTRDKSGAAQQTLELHKVERTSFDITVTANGELEAKRQTEIRSKLESPAAIVEVAPEGVFVKKGDLLVKLSSEAIETQRDDQLLRVESARSELTAAENDYQIQLNENDASLRQSILKVDLAKIELNKWLEGDDKKQRQLNELAIDKADQELIRVRDSTEETRKLLAKGFSSRDDMLLAEKALTEAEANAKTTKLDKEVYETYEREKQIKKLTSDVEEAEAELERTKRKNDSQITIKEANRTNKRRQLALLEEKLSKLEEQIVNSTITAPTDGLVVYATSVGRGRGMMMMGGDPIQIGKNCQPNDLIIVLPETGSMVASVRVHESLAGSLKPGQKATLHIEAVGAQPFEGTVDSIGVLAETDGWRDPNLREYTVKIDLNADNEGQRLKPSMRCEAEVVLSAVRDTLAVPLQAIFRDGALSFVYVPSGNKFERVPVMLGKRSSMMIALRDLPPNLVTEYNIPFIKEGDSVLLREPAPNEVVGSKFDDKMIAALTPGMGGPGAPGGAPGSRAVRAATPGAKGAQAIVAGGDSKGPAKPPEGAQIVAKQGEGAAPVVIPADDKRAQDLVKRVKDDAATAPHPESAKPQADAQAAPAQPADVKPVEKPLEQKPAKSTE